MKPKDLPDLNALRLARHNQRVEYNPRARTLDTERPFVITALLLDRTLGDFVYRALFAATVKQRFRDARLIVYYRDDRPYKNPILRLVSHIDRSWRMEGMETMPLDNFDTMGGRLVTASDRDWYHSLSAEPDLVLTPTMMHFQRLASMTPLARFSVPDELAPAMREGLRRAGLDENRWFCVLHFREAGYRDDGGRVNRDMTPDEPEEVIRFIIEDLGGQVVRIGHPGMTKLSARRGLVDLADAENPLLVHAHAVSRARFFLELSPSGPMALAGAFGVPLARCNGVSTLGPLEAPSFTLMQHIVGEDGTRVPTDIARRKGLFSEIAVEQVIKRYGYRFERNDVAELRAAALEIHDRTTDCAGWREVAAPVITSYPESFCTPLAPAPEIEVLEFPDAMPVFGPNG